MAIFAPSSSPLPSAFLQDNTKPFKAHYPKLNLHLLKPQFVPVKFSQNSSPRRLNAVAAEVSTAEPSSEAARRLYVGNIPRTVTNDKLRKMVKEHGAVEKAELLVKEPREKSLASYIELRAVPGVKYLSRSGQPLIKSCSGERSRKLIQKKRKEEHHLWHKRDSAGSGQKALNLVRIIFGLPHEKEAVYHALNKWIAWETEFPTIAAAKALKILRKRNQWERVIQLAKWMLSKGQGATMTTYDCLLLAFDMDGRADEAETLWSMILHSHNRSISKRLFSRMISLYDHHNFPDKVIEVFADMEELGVKPDEDTVRRVARAFKALGQEDKKKLVMKKYGSKWKYIHFNGERVRVRTHSPDETSCSDTESHY